MTSEGPSTSEVAMSETQFVRRLRYSGNGDRSGLRAIVVIAGPRGPGQGDRIFRLTGGLRREAHLRRSAPARVWAGHR